MQPSTEKEQKMRFIFAAPHPTLPPAAQKAVVRGTGWKGGNLHLKILVGWPETFGAIADPVLCVCVCVRACACVRVCACVCVCGRLDTVGGVGEKTLRKQDSGEGTRQCLS